MIENNKDEILERSRNAKKDEGMEYAKLRGNKLGESVMSIAAIPILVFAFLRGEFALFFAVGVPIAAFVFAQCLMEYRFSKRMYHLVWTIAMAIGTLVCMVLFLALSFGWKVWSEPYLFGWLPL